MENQNNKSKKNKRNRNTAEITPSNQDVSQDLTDEHSDKNILKKYLNRNIEDLSQTEYRKLKIYIDEIRTLIKNYEKKNFDGLVQLAESNVLYQISLIIIIQLNILNSHELNDFKLVNNKKQLFLKNEQLKKENEEMTKKSNDKEKFSNLLLEKIKSINEEKIKIIQDITEKRNEIVIETENYVKDIQTKFQNELPQKQKLLEENQKLRDELEDFTKKSSCMKEEIEKEISDKEKMNIDLQSDFINKYKNKLEKIQTEKETLFIENIKLKTEIEEYKKTKDDRESTHQKYVMEWEKFAKENEDVYNIFFLSKIQKKKDLILYSKENMEIRMSIHENMSLEKFNEMNKEFQKTKNQLNAMNNLGRKYQDQIEKLIAENPELTTIQRSELMKNN